MSTLALLDAFRALPTNAARKEALSALADEFSPYEWRQMQALANARSFHFDIIGELPTELAFHVFSYLDIATPFRLQTVSRRWCNVLRSADLFKPRLRDWYDNTLDFEDASYEDCFDKAQAIYRVQTGKFLEVSATRLLHELYHSDSGVEGPNFERIRLVDDFLVDIPYPFRHLRVTNLRTGQYWIAHADGREVISSVAASSQLIAFWTQHRQTCYVFDFTGTRKAKFRLPPFMSGIATCGERTVICGGITNGNIELYLWDLDSSSGKTLRLDQSLFNYHALPDHCLAINLIPNPRSSTCTLFITRTCEARWCGHQNQDLSIHYYNIAFDGQILQNNSFMIPLPGPAILAGATITSIRPINRKGGFLVKVFCRYDHDGHIASFQFDADTQVCNIVEQLTRSSDHTKTACWEDSFYRAEEEILERNAARISLLHWNTGGSNISKDPLFVDEREDLALINSTHAGIVATQLLVNDRFVVMVAMEKTYVFSFAAEAKTTKADEFQVGEVQGERFVLRKVHPKAGS
ncbi:hypothetical protein BU23DRAFT_549956 [Bimuria novae-zelandiae CBS 107.79]|uniref:F-box domain-containing protein n=1 Tax=Bimuria novae-zelandiae CBS 107.79 TaxID=1447943 RepID=A0A6A5VPR0_9PLEO|nr:hypothetical protein BU23DRAFT_549956 [Bimuria novae-zelandiae CBS 107.79]